MSRLIAAALALGVLVTPAVAADAKYALVAIPDKDNPHPGEVTVADLSNGKCLELKRVFDLLPRKKVSFACFRQSGLYFKGD